MEQNYREARQTEINELKAQIENLESELALCAKKNKQYLEFIKQFSDDVLGKD